MKKLLTLVKNKLSLIVIVILATAVGGLATTQVLDNQANVTIGQYGNQVAGSFVTPKTLVLVMWAYIQTYAHLNPFWMLPYDINRIKKLVPVAVIQVFVGFGEH
jgi:hypothetical protein